MLTIKYILKYKVYIIVILVVKA